MTPRRKINWLMQKLTNTVSLVSKIENGTTYVYHKWGKYNAYFICGDDSAEISITERTPNNVKDVYKLCWYMRGGTKHTHESLIDFDLSFIGE